MKKLLMTVGLAAAFALSVAANAHHSYAMFDLTQTVEKQATVKELKWTAPHAFLHVIAPDDKGGATEWTLEVAVMAPPDAGWGRKTLAAGDKVTVYFHPLRSGAFGGQMVAVKDEKNGKTYGKVNQDMIGIDSIKNAEKELKEAGK